jgi:predicted RND superfamily exporter protein
VSRRLRLLLASVVLLAAGLWVAAGLARLEVDSDLDSLLPADDPAVAELESMARAFGGDPVVVLVEGAGDPLAADRLPGLLQLEGELSAVDGAVATYGPATTLNQTVVQIKRFLAEISGRRDALKEAGRTRELRQFEARYGALLVQALPSGLPTLKNANFVRSVVLDPDTQQPKPQWQQYLPADGAVAIYLRPREGLDADAAARLSADVEKVVEDSAAVPDAAEVTVTGAPVVSAGLADRMRSEVPRLGAGAFLVVAAVLLIVPWGRRRRWQLAPLLVMGAATAATLAGFGWRDDPLSLGAATFLPIILGLGSYYPVYLSRPGHRRVVLAVATSSTLAFAGLVVSPLPFVSDLGLAIPLGLALVVVLSLGVAWARGPRPADDPELVATPSRPSRVRLPTGVLAGIAVLAVVGSALGWVALASAPLKTDPQQLLAGLPALDDAVHVEDVVGYSGEVDVRLIGDDVLTPAALDWSRQAQDEVVSLYGDRMRPVVTVSQLLGFLGEDPTDAQVRAGIEALPDYITSAVVSSDQTQALTSYGVAWTDLADDRGLLAEVRSALPEPPAGYEVEVSGLPVAAERGYHLVSGDRYEASLVSLLAAFGALVLLLPFRRDAVAALLAAACASGLTIAVLATLVGALNPLTLALGALTAAIGSEFTVLLLAAARQRSRDLGRSVLLAVLLSLGGYGVLLTSSLPLVRELGLALVTSVALSVGIACVLAELISRAGTASRTAGPPPSADHHVPDPVSGTEVASLQLIGGTHGS